MGVRIPFPREAYIYLPITQEVAGPPCPPPSLSLSLLHTHTLTNTHTLSLSRSLSLTHTLSLAGLLSVAFGTHVEVWKDALSQKAKAPYMSHHTQVRAPALPPLARSLTVHMHLSLSRSLYL